MNNFKEDISIWISYSSVIVLLGFILLSFAFGFSDGMMTSDCKPERIISYINVPWRLSCEMTMKRDVVRRLAK